MFAYKKDFTDFCNFYLSILYSERAGAAERAVVTGSSQSSLLSSSQAAAAKLTVSTLLYLLLSSPDTASSQPTFTGIIISITRKTVFLKFQLKYFL